MKKITILLGLMAVTMSATAQEQANNFSFELGKLTPYELTMTEYEADKTADAIVIYEGGDFYFKYTERDNDYYFALVKTYKTKIKILKSSGVERGKFAIPIFKESEYMFEKFYIQTANVYNYNTQTNQIEQSVFEDEAWLIAGKKVKEVKLNNNYTINEFTLPNVKVGSIIELEYVVETPFVFSFQWQFQKSIPVIYSKIRCRTNAFYAYTSRLNSNKKFDEYNEETLLEQIFNQREKAFTFGMKNLPSLKKDSKSRMLAIDFQLQEQRHGTVSSFKVFCDWKEYSSEILSYDDFGKYIKKTEKEAKKILQPLNLSGKSQNETMESVLNYVKTNYKWNGLYGKYVLHQLPDFLKDKTGNAANLNLFLIALLNKAGINAVPVLISQYEVGDVAKSHPYDNIFNYVIARVTINNTAYYLDAAGFKQTAELTGFVVKKNSNEFVQIEKIEPNAINNLTTEQEKYDCDGEFTTFLNSLKKVFYFLK
ncbi:MAG: DUF3857 domain-containing protein [Prevotellaceae bacterium]|jgi:hypothetical protein|nr:DUF3857 domain-containing protein [Prevotellaceae bacterium]